MKIDYLTINNDAITWIVLFLVIIGTTKLCKDVFKFLWFIFKRILHRLHICIEKDYFRMFACKRLCKKKRVNFYTYAEVFGHDYKALRKYLNQYRR